MKKFTWRGEKANLVGHLINEGHDMSFDLLDRDNKKIIVNPKYGITVISTFPALNTEICDKQSSWMAKMANIYREISFISISTDTPKTINEWCNARKYSNLRAYSDYHKDFGTKTNTLLKKKQELARGFMIFKDGKLVEVSYNTEVQSEPNYEVVEKYL